GHGTSTWLAWKTHIAAWSRGARRPARRRLEHAGPQPRGRDHPLQRRRLGDAEIGPGTRIWYAHRVARRPPTPSWPTRQGATMRREFLSFSQPRSGKEKSTRWSRGCASV